MTDPAPQVLPQEPKKLLHIYARQSPYQGTLIRRFPVFDKYVPWEVSNKIIVSCFNGKRKKVTSQISAYNLVAARCFLSCKAPLPLLCSILWLQGASYHARLLYLSCVQSCGCKVLLLIMQGSSTSLVFNLVAARCFLSCKAPLPLLCSVLWLQGASYHARLLYLSCVQSCGCKVLLIMQGSSPSLVFTWARSLQPFL